MTFLGWFLAILIVVVAVCMFFDLLAKFLISGLCGILALVEAAMIIFDKRR